MLELRKAKIKVNISAGQRDKLNNMINQFEKLTSDERALLYKAPVLISVIASCSFGEINPSQKSDAIKLAHIKTFTAIPSLLAYYDQVDKDFKKEFEATVQKYFPFDKEKKNALMKEINRANAVIEKLDKNFGQQLFKSLLRFTNHVKKSTHSIFQDFLFPIPIQWLSS